MSINIAYYLFFIIEASLSGNIGTKLQKFVEPILPHYWNNVLQHWDKVVLHCNAFFIYIHYCFAIMHQCCLNIFLSMLNVAKFCTNVMLLQLCKTIVGQHHRQWWRNVLSTQIATWVQYGFRHRPTMRVIGDRYRIWLNIKDTDTFIYLIWT